MHKAEGISVFVNSIPLLSLLSSFHKVFLRWHFHQCKWRQAPEVSRLSSISNSDDSVFIIPCIVIVTMSRSSGSGGGWTLRANESGWVESVAAVPTRYFRFGEPPRPLRAWRSPTSGGSVPRKSVAVFESRPPLHCLLLLLSMILSVSSIFYGSKLLFCFIRVHNLHSLELSLLQMEIKC